MAFHVPEAARDQHHAILASTPADGNNGFFLLESPAPGWRLALIASDGEGWEHVSVHCFRGTNRRTLQSRLPTWREMSYVKDLCWDPEDVVMQLHPKQSEYINQHPHVLHLWRPIGVTIPTPPAILVGERADAEVPV